jgi:hypothetical protein
LRLSRVVTPCGKITHGVTWLGHSLSLYGTLFSVLTATLWLCLQKTWSNKQSERSGLYTHSAKGSPVPMGKLVVNWTLRLCEFTAFHSLFVFIFLIFVSLYLHLSVSLHLLLLFFRVSISLLFSLVLLFHPYFPYSIGKGKKVKLSLCLTKHHTLKMFLLLKYHAV